MSGLRAHVDELARPPGQRGFVERFRTAPPPDPALSLPEWLVCCLPRLAGWRLRRMLWWGSTSILPCFSSVRIQRGALRFTSSAS